MPRLSDLTKLKVDLIEINKRLSISTFIDENLKKIDTLDHGHNQLGYDITGLSEYYKKLYSIDSSTTELIDQLIARIDSDIDLTLQEMLTNTDYSNKFTYSGTLATAIHSNHLPMDDNAKSMLLSSIHKNTNWRYPGLLLGCRSSEWINAMNLCDPLYLTNYNPVSIKDLINHYSIVYQRRLRTYIVNDYDFLDLPQEQFKIVASVDYFNYIQYEEIKKCIYQVYNLLKPGGTFIFSYNNCDLPSSAILVDKGIMSYCSSKKLQSDCLEAGFEISAVKDMKIEDTTYNHLSWIELGKPGKLYTSKSKPTLGLIGQK